jgi:hypothetical protein
MHSNEILSNVGNEGIHSLVSIFLLHWRVVSFSVMMLQIESFTVTVRRARRGGTHLRRAALYTFPSLPSFFTFTTPSLTALSTFLSRDSTRPL